MKRITIGIVALVLFCGVLVLAQSKERPRMLRAEGSLAGSVSVFFPSDLPPSHKFGEIACVESFTGPTLVFYSDIVGPRGHVGPDRFSMNVEFLREIVQIADAEYAKAPCKGDKP